MPVHSAERVQEVVDPLFRAVRRVIGRMMSAISPERIDIDTEREP